MDRWPILSSPSLCGSTTEKEYTSPDLSVASSSSSARLNVRAVHLLTTHLCNEFLVTDENKPLSTETNGSHGCVSVRIMRREHMRSGYFVAR
ncbi:hypothetical protein EYF80_041391 [Liparis tanakae]|uniref:Uncharacterized protein n=1 Tax=Liparis tanakae TaxID=230148 RepID=A0A4Z2G5Q3_9TELE|nr:hypothetical protein EYF80_041391 [Liparis tanakae]